MNERIKELKYRAEEMAWSEHKTNCIKNGLDPSMPHANALNMTFEKFAELIVRECAELSVNSQYTNTKSEYYEGFNEALIYAGNKIRKHFGVE